MYYLTIYYVSLLPTSQATLLSAYCNIQILLRTILRNYKLAKSVHLRACVELHEPRLFTPGCNTFS